MGLWRNPGREVNEYSLPFYQSITHTHTRSHARMHAHTNTPGHLWDAALEQCWYTTNTPFGLSSNIWFLLHCADLVNFHLSLNNSSTTTWRHFLKATSTSHPPSPRLASIPSSVFPTTDTYSIQVLCLLRGYCRSPLKRLEAARGQKPHISSLHTSIKHWAYHILVNESIH